MRTARPGRGTTTATRWWTTDNCGSTEFVDYGEGEPGGGNDDYILVRDFCDDGYEFKADVWFAYSWLGTVYHAGGPMAGPLFNLGFNCRYEQRTIVDG